MVKSKSDTRFSSIILTQTDTTVGFLSLDKDKLYAIKSRDSTKKFIRVFKDFASLDIRIPQIHKTYIRRAKKTTFIVKSDSFRVAKEHKNSQIFRDNSWFYSTSANKSGKSFELSFCIDKADIIIDDKDGLNELMPSKIFKINNLKKRRLR